MNDQVATIVTTFLYILITAIVIRSLLSFFPIDRNGQFVRLLDSVTEPLIQPVRRLMPRTGMFDFSPMIVIIVLIVMVRVVEMAARQ